MPPLERRPYYPVVRAISATLITPQNELTEYMAKRMTELGRVFI
jgi:hypothetical protein